MSGQSLSIVMTIIGILLTIIGFFCSFLLYLIFAKQSSTEEKLVTALSKIEGLEQAKQSTESIIKYILEQIALKCNKDNCPYLIERR
jgi:hypothetical protein